MDLIGPCLSSEIYFSRVGSFDELTGRQIVYYRALSIIARLKTRIKFGYGKSIILLGSCNPLVAAMFLLVTTSSQLAVKTCSHAGQDYQSRRSGLAEADMEPGAKTINDMKKPRIDSNKIKLKYFKIPIATRHNDGEI